MAPSRLINEFCIGHAKILNVDISVFMSPLFFHSHINWSVAQWRGTLGIVSIKGDIPTLGLV